MVSLRPQEQVSFEPLKLLNYYHNLTLGNHLNAVQERWSAGRGNLIAGKKFTLFVLVSLLWPGCGEGALLV